MKQIWSGIQIAFTAFGGFLGWFLGGFDGFLYALIAFTVIDYITGVMCAVTDKNLSSSVGFKGICRKVLIFTLVGIGAMHDSATIVKSGALNQNDLFYLKMHNAVGDVLCHFLDKDGQVIHTPIEDRLISTPLDRLKSMNNVIGLAAGREKIEAIRAVLRGGYLDILITDEPTANLLLKDD